MQFEIDGIILDRYIYYIVICTIAIACVLLAQTMNPKYINCLGLFLLLHLVCLFTYFRACLSSSH
jgi:hypothetical protein